MKIIYECETCHQQFATQDDCIHCEYSHLDNYDNYKYYLMNAKGDNICKFCNNAYYVYGCELDCSYTNCNRTNNYKDFIIKENKL